MRRNLFNRRVAAAAAMAAAGLVSQPVIGQEEGAVDRASAQTQTETESVAPGLELSEPPDASVEAKGVRVSIDPTTRRFITGPPITLDQLPASVRARLSRSVQGLSPQVLANGATVLDFQGRFQTMSVVSLSPDGERTSACVETPESLTAFLAGTPETESDTDTETQHER